jgi:hypothetical protein
MRTDGIVTCMVHDAPENEYNVMKIKSSGLCYTRIWKFWVTYYDGDFKGTGSDP